jgi:hypothetical protein
MIIDARKKSLDPIQEELREKKSVWNKEVSEFINNLIQFKKLINGSPSKFHMEKSKIFEPIPDNPVSILDSLIENFRDISVKGNEIISQQIDYSKVRKKKSIPSEKTPDLSKQLSSKIDFDKIIQKLGATYCGNVEVRSGYFGALELIEEVKHLKEIISEK